MNKERYSNDLHLLQPWCVMTFTVVEQRYPCYDGSTPLSYAIFVEGEFEHDEDWGMEGFVAYSWSREGAERAIAELERK